MVAVDVSPLRSVEWCDGVFLLASRAREAERANRIPGSSCRHRTLRAARALLVELMACAGHSPSARATPKLTSPRCSGGNHLLAAAAAPTLDAVAHWHLSRKFSDCGVAIAHLGDGCSSHHFHSCRHAAGACGMAAKVRGIWFVSGY